MIMVGSRPRWAAAQQRPSPAADVAAGALFYPLVVTPLGPRRIFTRSAQDGRYCTAIDNVLRHSPTASSIRPNPATREAAGRGDRQLSNRADGHVQVAAMLIAYDGACSPR